MNNNEITILRILLTETILKIKVENAQTTTIESNIDSPQGDSISGLRFILIMPFSN